MRSGSLLPPAGPGEQQWTRQGNNEVDDHFLIESKHGVIFPIGLWKSRERRGSKLRLTFKSTFLRLENLRPQMKTKPETLKKWIWQDLSLVHELAFWNPFPMEGLGPTST